MARNRYEAEAELARRALGYPFGALRAWDAGELVGAIDSDVACAIVGACVRWRARGEHVGPDCDAKATLLGRLAVASLRIADAWSDRDAGNVREPPAWLSPVWSIREVSAGVSALAIGMIGEADRVRAWGEAMAAWRDVVRLERRAA